MKTIGVEIIDPDHPHFGECGKFSGKTVVLLGKTPMAEVELQNCEHGTDACFVSKGQVKSVLIERP